MTDGHPLSINRATSPGHSDFGSNDIAAIDASPPRNKIN